MIQTTIDQLNALKLKAARLKSQGSILSCFAKSTAKVTAQNLTQPTAGPSSSLDLPCDKTPNATSDDINPITSTTSGQTNDNNPKPFSSQIRTPVTPAQYSIKADMFHCFV